MKKISGILFLIFVIMAFKPSEGPTIKMALIKYGGGGDWYSNPTALPNLAQFCNQQIGTNFDKDYATVEVGSADLYNYPFAHLTGHGNVLFSDLDAANLRNYLIGGGFLHIDDNYGMDPYIRPSMKKVFPELEFKELPFEHPIYHQTFSFKKGLPKIHKHDEKSPQGYGLIWEGRVVCYYSYESDLGDGWEDQEVHKDPQSVREEALRMGANIVQFAFEQ